MAASNLDVPDLRQVRRAQVAVSVGFFTFGLAFALWAVHIPTITARLALDPAGLGLALLNVGLGGVISQPITGWMLGRTSSRPAAAMLLLVFLVVVIAPIVAWNLPLLFATTLALGAAAGAANVAINTQASEIERARRRPTMSWFHGFFSLGALAGASIGGAIIAADRQDGSGAAVVLAILFAVAIVASRYFLPAPPAPRSTRQKPAGKRFALPSGAVLGLAVLTFFSNMVEGAVSDWSTLYLSAVRNLEPAAAVSGLAIFSLAMAICRLAGGPVVTKLGERAVVLLGGVLMAIGMAVVVLSPWAFISPFGFALVAIGAANTIPLMISAASRAPGTAASTGVAATATGALLGFLIGPPVIGFVAQAAGLSVGLGLLSVVGIVIVVGAALYRWPAGAQSVVPSGGTGAR
jgi:predicted MFS family arabinose efflux permease